MPILQLGLQVLTIENSITIVDDTLSLVNDVLNPGNDYYYGTNEIGIKGFYSFSAKTVTNIIGTANQILANGTSGVNQNGSVTLALASSLTGINSVTSTVGENLVFAVGTGQTTLTFTGSGLDASFSGGGNVSISSGNISISGQGLFDPKISFLVADVTLGSLGIISNSFILEGSSYSVVLNNDSGNITLDTNGHISVSNNFVVSNGAMTVGSNTSYSANLILTGSSGIGPRSITFEQVIGSTSANISLLPNDSNSEQTLYVNFSPTGKFLVDGKILAIQNITSGLSELSDSISIHNSFDWGRIIVRGNTSGGNYGKLSIDSFDGVGSPWEEVEFGGTMATFHNGCLTVNGRGVNTILNGGSDSSILHIRSGQTYDTSHSSIQFQRGFDIYGHIGTTGLFNGLGGPPYNDMAIWTPNQKFFVVTNEFLIYNNSFATIASFNSDQNMTLIGNITAEGSSHKFGTGSSCIQITQNQSSIETLDSVGYLDITGYTLKLATRSYGLAGASISLDASNVGYPAITLDAGSNGVAVTGGGGITSDRWVTTIGDVTSYSPSVNIYFSGSSMQYLDIYTSTLDFYTSNLQAGCTVRILLNNASGSHCSFTYFPPWSWRNGAAPTGLDAYKKATLTLTCWGGTSDNEIEAEYNYEL